MSAISANIWRRARYALAVSGPSNPWARLSVADAPTKADVEVLPHARRPTMKAADHAFLTGPPETARFLPLAPAAENGIFKEHLVQGRGLMGKRSGLLFDNYLGIGE